MVSLELSGVFVKIGFALSFLANSFLIYLTAFHVKIVFGTYKRMVMIFATIGILFSGLEVIARPFAHCYNNWLVYFSLNDSIESQKLLQIMMMIWAGFYVVIVVFISVQFVFRYVCLFASDKIRHFGGWKMVFWLGYPCVLAVGYGTIFYVVCQPNENMEMVLRPILLDAYSLEIRDVSRFIISPYLPDGSSFDFTVLSFVLFAIGTINFHYAIILYCGFKMHAFMKKGMPKFSKNQQKIQRQFFRALVAQSLGPTIFLVLPSIPLLATPLLAPYLGTVVNFRLGWAYSIVGLFPPFDSIAFMLIVTEYKRIIRNQLSICLTGKPGQYQTASKSSQSQLQVIDKI